MLDRKRLPTALVSANLAAAVLLSGAPACANGCDFDALGVALGVGIGSLSAATTIFVAPAIVTAADTTDQAEYVTGMAWTTLGAAVGLAATSTGTIAWIAHHPCIDFELSLSLPAIGAVTGGVAASIIYGLASTSGDDEETGAAGQTLLGSREQAVTAVSLPLLSGRF